MPPPAGAVGFKLSDRATGKWLDKAGPTATEPAATPFVAGSGSAADTIYSQDSGLPDPAGPVMLFFYDAANKRVGDGVPLMPQTPARLMLVLNKTVASWPAG
jgi:hypothetical protein